MVLTLANFLQLPITVFTTIQKCLFCLHLHRLSLCILFFWPRLVDGGHRYFGHLQKCVQPSCARKHLRLIDEYASPLKLDFHPQLHFKCAISFWGDFAVHNSNIAFFILIALVQVILKLVYVACTLGVSSVVPPRQLCTVSKHAIYLQPFIDKRRPEGPLVTPRYICI